MIEKKIHYVWFGGEVPHHVMENVAKWHELMPEWEIFFWNEKNLPNFEDDEYTQLIIKEKRYGFASDLLRYQLVNKFGGFYLDTDMVLLRSLDSLCNQGTVIGFMYDNNLHTGMFGAEAGSDWIKKMIRVYTNPNEKLFYLTRDFSYTSNIIVTLATKEMFQSNFHLNGTTQIMDDGTLILSKRFYVFTNHKVDGFSRHEFSNSWNDGKAYKGIRGKVKQLIRTIFGVQTMENISAQVGKLRTKKMLKRLGVNE